MAKSSKIEASDFKAVRDSIRQTKLERVYLLLSEESFLVEKIIAEIAAKRFHGGEIDPMSWEVYRSNETGVQTVLDAVRTVSMFGGEKVVIYRDIDKLPVSDLARIANYAENPVRAYLVLTAAKADSPARGKGATEKGAPTKTATWKKLQEHAKTIVFEPLPANDYKGKINAYIRFAASERNLKIDEAAVDALKNCIGPNRALIERAIEKLSLACPQGDTITAQIVDEHVFDTRERSIFELTRAISARDYPKAISSLGILLDQEQEAIMINGMLAQHARRLIQTKRAVDKHLTDQEIASLLGFNSVFFAKEYIGAAQKYTLRELYRFHSDIFEADRSMKSKPMPANLVLGRVLMNLMLKSNF